MAKKIALNSIIFLLCPFIYWALVNTAIDAIANFSNSNIKTADNFNAATLALQTNSEADFKIKITPNKTTNRLITIIASENKIKPQYSIIAADFKGELCPALRLNAFLNKKIKFKGLLTDFSQTLLLGRRPANWNFVLSLNSSDINLENKYCDFVFNFYADENNQPQQIKNHVYSDAWQIKKRQAKKGEIIINEIMLANPNAYYNDSWLELKNNTNNDFDISGWTLLNVLTGQKNLRLPNKTILPAKGYFLLARYHTSNTRSLRNIDADLIVGSLSLNAASNHPIALLDSQGNLIDKISLPSQNKPFYSWQRNDFFSKTASLQPNWLLCQNKLAQSQIFWQKTGIACGTPKAKNLITANEQQTNIIEKPLVYSLPQLTKNDPRVKSVNKSNKIKPIKILTAKPTAPKASLNLSKIKVIPIK